MLERKGLGSTPPSSFKVDEGILHTRIENRIAEMKARGESVRPDDNPETLEKRVHAYRVQTAPLVIILQGSRDIAVGRRHGPDPAGFPPPSTSYLAPPRPLNGPAAGAGRRKPCENAVRWPKRPGPPPRRPQANPRPPRAAKPKRSRTTKVTSGAPRRRVARAAAAGPPSRRVRKTKKKAINKAVEEVDECGKTA